MPKDIKDRKLAEARSIHNTNHGTRSVFSPCQKGWNAGFGTPIARCARASDKTYSLWGKTISKILFVPLEQQSV